MNFKNYLTNRMKIIELFFLVLQLYLSYCPPATIQSLMEIQVVKEKKGKEVFSLFLDIKSLQL